MHARGSERRIVNRFEADNLLACVCLNEMTGRMGRRLEIISLRAHRGPLDCARRGRGRRLRRRRRPCRPRGAATRLSTTGPGPCPRALGAARRGHLVGAALQVRQASRLGRPAGKKGKSSA